MQLAHRVATLEAAAGDLEVKQKLSLMQSQLEQVCSEREGAKATSKASISCSIWCQDEPLLDGGRVDDRLSHVRSSAHWVETRVKGCKLGTAHIAGGILNASSSQAPHLMHVDLVGPVPQQHVHGSWDFRLPLLPAPQAQRMPQGQGVNEAKVQYF